MYYYYTVYIIDHKYIIIDQNKYIHFIEMHGNAYPDLQREKGIQKWAEIAVKWGKCQEIYKCWLQQVIMKLYKLHDL